MILLSLYPPELFSYLGVVRASRSEVIDRKVDNIIRAGSPFPQSLHLCVAIRVIPSSPSYLGKSGCFCCAPFPSPGYLVIPVVVSEAADTCPPVYLLP